MESLSDPVIFILTCLAVFGTCAMLVFNTVLPVPSQPRKARIAEFPTVWEVYSRLPRNMLRKRSLKAEEVKKMPKLELTLEPKAYEDAASGLWASFQVLAGYAPPDIPALRGEEVDADCLPIMAPMAVMCRLQQGLYANDWFPLRVVGAVLARHETKLLRDMSMTDAMEFKCGTAGGRVTSKGHTEVDFKCTATPPDHERVWESVVTICVPNPEVRRSRSRAERAEGKPPTVPPPEAGETAPCVQDEGATAAGASGGDDPAEWTLLRLWELPAGLGREYAAHSWDYNPIHLAALPARAFGFRAAVAHGLCLASRAVAAIERSDEGRRMQLRPDDEHALVVRSQFHRPTFLPSTMALLIAPVKGGMRYRIVSWTDELSKVVSVEGRQSVKTEKVPLSACSKANVTGELVLEKYEPEHKTFAGVATS